jgi:hypothetical protein
MYENKAIHIIIYQTKLTGNDLITHELCTNSPLLDKQSLIFFAVAMLNIHCKTACTFLTILSREYLLLQCRKGRATGRRRVAGLADPRRETEAGQRPARVEPSDLGRAAAEGGREERRAEAREREGGRATVQRKVWRTDAQREGGRAAWSCGRTTGGGAEGGRNRSSEDVVVARGGGW